MIIRGGTFGPVATMHPGEWPGVAIRRNRRSPSSRTSPSWRIRSGVTPGVGGGLPNSAGLKGAGAATQSSSPSPTHTGRPRAAQTWFSTTWSQWPCVSTTATGVTSRRSSVWATQASESIAGSTTHALPPRSSATT